MTNFKRTTYENTSNVISKENSLISSLSHNTPLINETREKGNFDDWYIIKLYINMKNALFPC